MRDARRKFWKEPLSGVAWTKPLLRQHISCHNRFSAQHLKAIAKTLAVDLLRLNTLRETKTAFLTLKGMTSTPGVFIWEFPSPPEHNISFTLSGCYSGCEHLYQWNAEIISYSVIRTCSLTYFAEFWQVMEIIMFSWAKFCCSAFTTDLFLQISHLSV